MSEYFILPIYDRAFYLETVEDYKTMIGFLFRTATEYAENYPDVDPQKIWAVYTSENWT